MMKTMEQYQLNATHTNKLKKLVKTDEDFLKFHIFKETHPNATTLALINDYRQMLLKERKMDITVMDKMYQGCSSEVDKLHIIEDIVLDVLPIQVVPMVDKVFNSNNQTLSPIYRSLLSNTTENPFRLIRNIS